METAHEALHIAELSKTFGTRKALDEVSFTLPSGAFLSIFGPNGAGKTTLLRILSTLTRASSGTIRILGNDAKENADTIREHIGFISHNSMLYPDLTAFENLTFAARLYGIEQPEARALEMLDAVELKHRRFDQVRTFSRGMTQRLSIARALIHDPELLFLDEPYSGLDPHAVEVLDGLLENVREGRTFVMVSHDLMKGFNMCTHALVLSKGHLVLFEEKDKLTLDEFAPLYKNVVGMGVA